MYLMGLYALSFLRFCYVYVTMILFVCQSQKKKAGLEKEKKERKKVSTEKIYVYEDD